jgi:hypothetical protein
MRRSALPIVIIACVIVAAVLAWMVVQRFFPQADATDPSVPAVSETRTPGEFAKVDLSGHLDVVLVQGATHEVVVEATPGQQGRIRTRVSGETLRVSVERSGWRPFRGRERVPRITITSPTFESVNASGTMRVHAKALEVPSFRFAAAGATSVKIEKLETDSLRFAGAGAVKADLAGRASELSVSLSGAGDVRAAELASDEAKVSVSGAGHVVVHANDTLRINLSGAGSVEYFGDPKVTKSVSGIGTVKRREGTPANAPSRPARFQVA